MLLLLAFQSDAIHRVYLVEAGVKYIFNSELNSSARLDLARLLDLHKIPKRPDLFIYFFRSDQTLESKNQMMNDILNNISQAHRVPTFHIDSNDIESFVAFIQRDPEEVPNYEKFIFQSAFEALATLRATPGQNLNFDIVQLFLDSRLRDSRLNVLRKIWLLKSHEQKAVALLELDKALAQHCFNKIKMLSAASNQ